VTPRYGAPMTATRSRTLAICLLTGLAVAAGGAAAPALEPPKAQKITADGVGDVKLGARYTTLRAAKLLGAIGPGCELAGPQARSAKLAAPLKGSVDFTLTNIRRVATISVSRGATARGVAVGSTQAHLRHRFPKVVFDHSTDTTFGLTIAKVPKSGGGRLQFAINTKTKKVTLIGIPRIPFCE